MLSAFPTPDSRFPTLGIGFLDRLFHHWFQGGVEEAVDEAGGCVVTARGFSLVAAGSLQFELPRAGVDLRVKLQQRFIDLSLIHI